MSRRCVLAVHAHPDDESSKGAASMAKYAALGVRTVLVTCTDGAAGESDATSDDDVVAIRARELAAAASILGYAAVHKLGYPDSGTAGEVPGAFASTDAHHVATQLGTILAEERPDVVVTYDAEYARGHPDHKMAHDATVLAFREHSSQRPSKLYGIRTHSPAQLASMHAWLSEHDLSSPYAAALASAGTDETTTRIAVHGFIAVARRALRAHRSQVTPDEPWFFAVPTDALEVIHPWDDYQLLDPRAALPGPDDAFETDLFAALA